MDDTQCCAAGSFPVQVPRGAELAQNSDRLQNEEATHLRCDTPMDITHLPSCSSAVPGIPIIYCMLLVNLQ